MTDKINGGANVMPEKTNSSVKLTQKRAFLIVCSFALIISIALTWISYTNSKYRYSHGQDGSNELQTFYAAVKIYDKLNNELPITEEVVNGKTKRYYQIPADDFEDLNISLTYKGEAKNYVRMRMDISWLRVNQYDSSTYDLILHELPTYEWGDPDAIYDNREIDNWIYFTNALGENNEEKTISVINLTHAHRDVQDPVEVGDKADYARIYVTLDCVQYNRATELWHLAKLPWK